MKIEARHVRRKQLAQYIDINHVRRERKGSESLNNSTSMTQLAKKRLSAEMGQLNNSTKRNKHHESVSSLDIVLKYLERFTIYFCDTRSKIIGRLTKSLVIFFYSKSLQTNLSEIFSFYFNKIILLFTIVIQSLTAQLTIQQPKFCSMRHLHRCPRLKLKLNSVRDDLMASLFDP